MKKTRPRAPSVSEIPAGQATVKQLEDMGLKPGKEQPVAGVLKTKNSMSALFIIADAVPLEGDGEQPRPTP